MLLGSLSSQLVCDVGYNYPHLQTKIPRLETASQPSQQYQGWEASLGTAAPRRAHQAPRYPDHPERLIPLYPIPCLLDHWPFSPYCPTLPWGSDSPTSQSLSEGWRKLRGNLLLRAMDGAGASTSPSKGAGAPTTDNRWEEEPKIDSRDVPGGSAAETLPCEAGDVGLIPGQRTRIPHAVGQLNLHTITNKPSHHNWREDCKPQLRLNAKLNKLRKSCPPIAYIPVRGDSNKIIYISMKKISVCSGLYSEISIHPL